jgi:hypothetical protein
VRIENFSAGEIGRVAAAKQRVGDPVPYDVILAFSTKFEAPFDITDWPPWSGFKTRFFGYHRDLGPATIAQMMGGRIVLEERRRGQWIAIIAIESPADAQLRDALADPLSRR